MLNRALPRRSFQAPTLLAAGGLALRLALEPR